METPLVTVITPSYNQAAFLEKTILSVLDQDYPNLEYMVVDGGSTDGSVEIIRRYAGQLTWWVSEKDSGQAEAINKGFMRAKGELVAWLNSDDMFQPGMIATAVKAFQAHPDTGLVYGDVLSVDGAGKPINLMTFSPYTLRDLMAFKFISQPGVMMRRSVLEQAGFLNESYHYLLDHELWLRMSRLAGMIYVPRQLAVARFHDAAKNLSQAPRFGDEALRLAAWLESQPEYADLFNRREVWAGAYRFQGWYLVEGGQPARALQAYYRSFKLQPRVALADWSRILYALLSLAGFSRMKPVFYRLRGSLRRRMHPEIYAPGSEK